MIANKRFESNNPMIQDLLDDAYKKIDENKGKVKNDFNMLGKKLIKKYGLKGSEVNVLIKEIKKLDNLKPYYKHLLKQGNDKLTATMIIVNEAIVFMLEDDLMKYTNDEVDDDSDIILNLIDEHYDDLFDDWGSALYKVEKKY